MNHIPCAIADSDETRYPDEMKPDSPMWTDHSDKCYCELSKHIDALSLCRLWANWRTNPSTLRKMLHGYWMLSTQSTMTYPMREIEFLTDLLDAEIDGD